MKRASTITQEPSAFSGLLKCPECGSNLNFHFDQSNHDIKFFSCQNHNFGLRRCSKTHYIRLDFLERVVLYEINRLAAFANEYEDDFIKAMMGRSAKVAKMARRGNSGSWMYFLNGSMRTMYRKERRHPVFQNVQAVRAGVG